MAGHRIIEVAILILLLSSNAIAQTSFTCQSRDIQNKIGGLPGRPGKSGPQGPKGEAGNSAGIGGNALLRINTLEAKLNSANDALAKQSKQLREFEQELKRVGDILKNIGQSGKAPPTPVPPRPAVSGKPRSCNEVSKAKALKLSTTGGSYMIYPPAQYAGMEVSCDTVTDGGGWIVFQRRKDGTVSFEKGWDEYVSGFGKSDGEFWLGLENLYKLTVAGNWELRVDMTDWDYTKKYAKYSMFKIGASSTNYKITVQGYMGDAGDGMTYHSGYSFTTHDRDNDPWATSNCASIHRGGWWFYKCANANLNGKYNFGGSYVDVLPVGVIWKPWRGFRYSLRTTEMKIRQVP